MRTIVLDASKWHTVMDFYRALLPAIGAPDWHGCSVDALIDSMIWGGINALEPPYTIKIVGVSLVPKIVLERLEIVEKALVDARAYFRRAEGHDVDVNFEISR